VTKICGNLVENWRETVRVGVRNRCFLIILVYVKEIMSLTFLVLQPYIRI
jgi:hypothetical protein